ncbi:NAD(+) kinase [Candida viswanathii]|uniref:NAD(+) kinase n=1 Tax=Candida viswanathii TaxID=5486 RepID=A0A367XWC7_9ASCO|nr:NAD(+) kinase [Candida viswanathii]
MNNNNNHSYNTNNNSHRAVFTSSSSTTNSSTSSLSELTTSSSFHRKNNMIPHSPKVHSKLVCDEISAALTSGTSTPRSIKSHTELAETANGVRLLAKNLSRATIQLDVRAIMVITKARDNSLITLTKQLVEWLLETHPHITIFVDAKLQQSKRFGVATCNSLKFWNKRLVKKQPELFDLVVTLGGDGTVLYASTLFQSIAPPVLPFSLGSLGFLTNFQFQDFKRILNRCIESGVKANLRMRFTCRVHANDGKLIGQYQTLNELVVDRGPSPYVTLLELYGDGSLLTVAQADGLIIATPTGSTAYSLSAGGSLVHPGVSAISVTPICPHTLSFRPILLPDGMFLKVKVPDGSRATAWCSFDGKDRTELHKGDYVTIQASPFPFPTVIASPNEYFDSVSRNLHWNVREQQKPLSDNSKDVDGAMDNLHISSEQDEEDEEPEITEEEDDFDINFTDTERSSYSSTPSSDDMNFLAGNGTATPQNMSYLNNVDERCCFAHPNARVHLSGGKS